jgi:putative NIF3 family GTP cyclohydrolase 1 type 2
MESVILCEHTNTERGFLNELQKKLSQKLPEFEFIPSKLDKDPLSVV